MATISQPVPPQSEASKLIGLLFSVGTAAAAIFVKNASHQATAGAILNVLQGLLPEIENLV